MTTTPRRRRSLRLAAVPALALAAALALAGCGNDSATGNEAAVGDDGEVDLSKVTLIVGDQKGTSAQQELSAAGLDDTPYKIEWKEFTSGPPLLEALNANAIHVGQVGNTPPIFAAAAGGEFKVVQAITYTGEGDAIMVPKDSTITEVSQLEGKKVAVAEGSSANYHLLAQLEKAGLTYSDIQVENLQPADALAAFTAGHVDAWAIWDPFTAQVQGTVGGKIIADGSDLVNGYAFQTASDAALDDPATKAALEDYLERITKAQLWASENPDEWGKIWGEQTGLDPAITTVASQRRPVTVLPIDDELVASEHDMADAFAENDLIPGEVDLDDWFDDEFNDDLTGLTAAAG
jgi:sulfonate transport system substrate-binding protein